MAFDSKPNLSNDKFEQFSGETLTLLGTTEVHGRFEVENGGIITSDSGFQISGTSFLSAGNDITSIELGNNTTGNGVGSIAIGANSQATTNGISIGVNTDASTNSISIGRDAQVNSTNSIGIGRAVNVTNPRSIGIGYSTCATNLCTVAVGNDIIASGSHSTAIGQLSCAEGSFSVSVGSSTRAASIHSTTLGNFACAVGSSAIMIGNGIDAGTYVTNNQASSIAFGWCTVEPQVRFASSASQFINGTGNLIIGSGATGMTGQTALAKVEIQGDLAIVDGTQQDGYVLTSDASGIATWQPSSGGSGGGGADGVVSGGTLNGSAILALGRTQGLGDVNIDLTALSGGSGGSTSPAGADTQIQFNNAGSFGANSNLLFVSASNSLTLGNRLGTEGNKSIAQGNFVFSTGVNSFGQGNIVRAYGDNSHAEGNTTLAYGCDSHAEGSGTKAYGSASHAEGNQTIACGINSHAEGYQTKIYSINSHAEGNQTIACGINSHAEGSNTKTYGTNSHAEGCFSCVFGDNSHAEGKSTIASGTSSHAEGNLSKAYGDNSHAEGSGTKSYGSGSHAEGAFTKACGAASHAEGCYTIACGLESHASGYGSLNREIIAGGRTSFIHSTNMSQINGHGANAERSAILGGKDHNIESGNTNAAIIGGNTIKLTGTSYIDTTAVSKLAIISGLTNNASSDEVLVRNTSTGVIDYVSKASIGGGGGGSADGVVSGGTLNGSAILALGRTQGLGDVNIDLTALSGGSGGLTTANNGLTKIGDNIVLGGTLTGNTCINLGTNNIVIGNNATASGDTSFSHGCAIAGGLRSFAVNQSFAEGTYSFASNNGVAHGSISFAVNNGISCGINSFSSGNASIAIGNCSNAQGDNTCAIGASSHSEGRLTKAYGNNSHVEGFFSRACGNESHAEGYYTKAIGCNSHSQGSNTCAVGNSSHASGIGCLTGGRNIKAVGNNSFIHSYNTLSQTSGHGALADFSAILGGKDHNIEVGNTGATIIGGNTIKLTSNTYIDTTAVSCMAIFTTPSSGGADDVLTWNATTKKVGKQTQATVAAASDKELKTKLEPISNALDGVILLQPYEYEFNEKMYPEHIRGQRRYGLIAQDVEKEFPIIIENNIKIDEIDYKGIRYVELVPILVQAIKELNIKVEDLKSLIKE